MNLPTDSLGRTSRAGDMITYPWRKGSTIGLNTLTLSQVTDESVSGCNHLAVAPRSATSRTSWS